MTRRSLFVSGFASGAVLAAQSRTRVIDAHSHLGYRAAPEDDRKLIDAADKLGIDQLCCSILPPERPATIEGFRQGNRRLAEVIRRFPDRILGYCFVNPGYGRAALDEVRRYVESGFIGVKLYNDYLVTDPVVTPLLELTVELRVPVLHHAGHTSWLPSPQPNISDGGHIARAARAVPGVMLICAHMCGGGDWEWTVKSLRDAPPGVYLDTSGSVADEGTVEFAVRTLGADRVLFATDLSMTASVGRLRGAEISPGDRSKILGANMASILGRRRA